jgi:hypothetical protein
MSLGRFRAFGLQSTLQSLSLHNLALDRAEELPVSRCCQTVYSEVDAKNPALQSRDFDINLFGERKHEIASASLVYAKQTLAQFPREIFSVALWNTEWYLDPAFDGSETEGVSFERSRAWEIVAHRGSLDDGLALCFLDHATRLLDASDGELCLQAELLQSSIDKGLQFDMVLQSFFPSSINAKLQSFGIDFQSANYLRSCNNLDFCCCPTLHSGERSNHLYKHFGNEEKAGISAIHPTAKARGLPCLPAL